MKRKPSYYLLTLILLISVLGSGNLANVTAAPANPANLPPPQSTPADQPASPDQPAVPNVVSIEFSDVLPGSLWYPFVHWLAGHAIVNGVGGGRFAPNDNTTRAQFAKMVVAGFGYALITPTSPSFTDVPTSNFAYTYIEVAKARGIITGFSASQCAAINATYPCFGPNRLITRVQLVLIVVRAKQWPLITPAQPTFHDVGPNSFGYADIETAVSHMVISGYAQSSQCGGNPPCFRANDNGTRGQLSKILYNALVPQGIDQERRTVLHGRVTERGGSSLASVTVSVLNHPEFGTAQTSASGSFTMTVNAGGILTVNYQKSGYLPAQRQLPTTWQQDDGWLPDVALVTLDPNVTTINFSQPIQVARGSTQSDAAGTRRATLLFSQGTTATMTLANGQVQPLPSLSVRATEFTVGAGGPAAMPGTLPRASGYTYAAAFTADEAVAAGASSVNFSQPVFSYNENFLGFPVGQAVPAGYYDPQRAVWVPNDNGRVVGILSVSGGLAILDVDGYGQPATTQELAAMGVSNAERSSLVSLYTVGQSLWRVPLTHFTADDWNWSYGPPPGAVPPTLPWFNGEQPWKDPCKEGGSIIECQNQSLGETLPVVGTDYNLIYKSSRMPGYNASYTLKIPVTGDIVPPFLLRTEIKVEVAGQQITSTFPITAPNQTYNFVWNGRDASGNLVNGTRDATVHVDYIYHAIYYGSVEGAVRSFGRVRGIEIGHDVNRIEISYGDTRTYPVGQYHSDNSALGGWSLDVHHSYDPVNKVLNLGDGSQLATQDVAPGISTFAGNGTSYSNISGDGDPATNASLQAESVAVGPDGSVYIGSNCRIRKVGLDGIITTFAGDGSCDPNGLGDGGPARLAQIDPLALAFGQDGSLYVASNGHVRTIDASGIITSLGVLTTTYFGGLYMAVGPDGDIYTNDIYNTVYMRTPDGTLAPFAGNGTFGFSGDGGPAISAQLTHPRGMAVGPDGSVYIADMDNYRVRKVSPDGIITTVVGTGAQPIDGRPNGDDGPATLAAIFPEYLAFAADGSLYMTDYYRIRRLRPDGIIEAAVGSDTIGFSGDGGPASQARLNRPRSLAFGPDGSLFFADFFNYRVRRVTLPSPAIDNGTTIVPSADGSEIYYFDSTGRHLRTEDALTRAVRYSFSYDLAGRLIGVSDAFSNTTTIERDSGGAATALVSPYGQRTSLTIGSDGWLSSYTDPTGGVIHLNYTPTGLLTGLTDARGGHYTFTYTAQGRLEADQDPTGGLKTVSRDSEPFFVTSVFTSPNGYADSYQVQSLAGKQQLMLNRAADGAGSDLLIHEDGSRLLTYTNGLRVSSQQSGDPLWGSRSPYISQYTMTTSGGLSAVTNNSRSVNLVFIGPLPTTNVLTATTSFNSRTYREVLDTHSGVLTATSPLGRRSLTQLNPQGRVLSNQSDPNILPTTNQFDARGRLITQQLGDRRLQYGYDAAGWVVSSSNAAGETTRYGHDAAGRVISTTTPAGHTYLYSYDANGNRTSVTMPSGAVHTLAYNAMGQPTSYTPAGNAAYVTTYDSGQLRTSVTMPDGRAESFSRDSGGRYTGQSYPEASITIAYSDTTNRPGLLTRTNSTGVTQTLAYAYDGSLITATTFSGISSGSYRYHYDNNFQLTSMQLDNNSAMPITHDGERQLTHFDYFDYLRAGPNGQANAIYYSNVMSLTLGYDNQARLASRRDIISGLNRYDMQLTRNNVGHISSRVEQISGTNVTQNYSYDADGQLRQVQRGGNVVEAYTYDANGNRVSRQLNGGPVETATYDPQDRLTAQGSTSYSFDANGFLSQRGADSFSYSTHGELLRAQLGSGRVVNYTYDGLGRMTARTTVSGTEQYLYGNPGNPFQVSASRSPAGVLTTYDYDEAGVLYALKQGYYFYYIASDQVGSPRLIINSSGVVVRMLDYDSFGNITSDSNPGFALPIGFAGGLRDADTGLLHFGWRDYDPQIGRWLGRDPLLYDGGQDNLYAYVGNDPVDYNDTSGLVSFTIGGYAVVGGTVSIAIDSNGISVSTGVGLGIGETISLDQGGKSKPSNLEVVASADAGLQAGPIGVGVSGKVGTDISGCQSSSAKGKVSLGPLQWEANLDHGKINLKGNGKYKPKVGESLKASVDAVLTVGTKW